MKNIIWIITIVYISLFAYYLFGHYSPQISPKIIKKENITNFTPRILIEKVKKIEENSKNENVSELTLMVNSINNILATYGLLLGIITLGIGITAFINYANFKKQITKYLVDNKNELTAELVKNQENTKLVLTKFEDDENQFNNTIDNKLIELENKEKGIDSKILLKLGEIERSEILNNEKVNNKIAELEKKEIEYDIKISQIEELKLKVKFQTSFIENSINYIYRTLFELADKKNDKVLINKVLYDFQKINLFSTKIEVLDASIKYFSESGDIDIIKDLEQIIEFHKDNSRLVSMINQTIGMIIERNKMV